MANVKGGGALPASLNTSGPVQAAPVRRVYLYTSRPTDGRPAIGGPATPVRVITDAQLKANGGQYTLTGDIEAIAMYTVSPGQPVSGGAAVPIYVVNP